MRKANDPRADGFLSPITTQAIELRRLEWVAFLSRQLATSTEEKWDLRFESKKAIIEMDLFEAHMIPRKWSVA